MGFILSRPRACWRILLISLWTALLILPITILKLAHANAPLHSLAQLWHRGVLKILNIKVHLQGTPLKTCDSKNGLLLVGNHISYLDIIVLSTLFPCRFIAKDDVAQWPVFGLFAKLQNSLFVSRTKKQNIPKIQAEIKQKLFLGYPYILFAEGTSSAGTYVLPYKSSLIQNGDDKYQIYAQAFAIQYSKLNGMPIGRFHRPYFGWYGDMQLTPHIWDLISLQSATAEVMLTKPIRTQAKKRKEITQQLQQQTQKSLETLRLNQ